jgi:hypothetical protein
MAEKVFQGLVGKSWSPSSPHISRPYMLPGLRLGLEMKVSSWECRFTLQGTVPLPLRWETCHRLEEALATDDFSDLLHSWPPPWRRKQKATDGGKDS